MKIGQRLALKFTIVSALLTGVILTVIFIVTRKNVHDDFIERLTKQSSLEVLHFATPHVKEVIPAGTFLLINPLISIFDNSGNLLFESGKYQNHSKWIGSVIDDEVFRVEEGDYTTIGKRYSVNGKTYIVFVTDKDLPGQNELDILMRAIVLGWILSVILSYGAGLYYSGNALRPVKDVVGQVKHITKDNLGYRLSAPTEKGGKPDEIEELIITFNALLDRIENAFHAQKRFVQHASHEIKTPITTIMGEAELALVKDRSSEEYKRTLSVVVSETERLVNITQGLLTLARFEEGYYNSELENVNLFDTIRHVVKAFSGRYPDRNIVWDGTANDLPVHGNAQLLQIAVGNLLDNALKYSQRDVTIRAEANSEIVIRIQDSGIGIPPADLQKVKAPMYRGGNVQSIPGAGLGLSLVHRIIEFHKGKLEIASQVNVGTTTSIFLPRDGHFSR